MMVAMVCQAGLWKNISSLCREEVLVRSMDWLIYVSFITDEVKKLLHIAGLLSYEAYQGVQRSSMTILDNLESRRLDLEDRHRAYKDPEQYIQQSRHRCRGGEEEARPPQAAGGVQSLCRLYHRVYLHLRPRRPQRHPARQIPPPKG